jgi:hypothetical protein
MCNPPQLSPQPTWKSMTHRFLQSAVLFFLSATPTPNLTHLDEPTMENKKRFICWVHGDSSSFAVHIDRENTIGDLKEAVVQRNRHRFEKIDPAQLEVYFASIPDTEVARNGFAFHDDEELPGSNEIQDHFSGPLKKDTIHFAIKLPGKQQPSILSTHIC